MIRGYQPTDLEDLLDVWSRASAVAHPFLSEDFLRREREAIPNIYLPNSETSVWQADGKVVGFISLVGSEIGAIFVDPDRHRSGIGRSLIEHARGDRATLEVEVFERNDIGRAFYGQLGFELIDRKHHADSGFDLLRLRMSASA